MKGNGGFARTGTSLYQNNPVFRMCYYFELLGIHQRSNLPQMLVYPVTGKIEAEDLTLSSSANVSADVTYRRIATEKGARITGKLALKP